MLQSSLLPTLAFPTQKRLVLESKFSFCSGITQIHSSLSCNLWKRFDVTCVAILHRSKECTHEKVFENGM